MKNNAISTYSNYNEIQENLPLLTQMKNSIKGAISSPISRKTRQSTH